MCERGVRVKECCGEAVAAAIIEGEFVDGETAVEGLFWTTIEEEFVAAVVAWLTLKRYMGKNTQLA